MGLHVLSVEFDTCLTHLCSQWLQRHCVRSGCVSCGVMCLIHVSFFEMVHFARS